MSRRSVSRSRTSAWIRVRSRMATSTPNPARRRTTSSASANGLVKTSAYWTAGFCDVRVLDERSFVKARHLPARDEGYLGDRRDTIDWPQDDCRVGVNESGDSRRR